MIVPPTPVASRLDPILLAFASIGTLALVAVGVAAEAPVTHLAPLAALVVIGTAGYRFFSRWDTLLALLILVIMLIPIRRYTVPGDLPFELEPYRLVVAMLAAAWLISLFIDQRVQIRRTGLEGPLALIAISCLGSVLLNSGRISGLGVDAEVTKKLTFFASFFITLYLVVSVARRAGVVEILVKTFVSAGAVVAAFAVVETRTGYNVFDHLSGVIPFLELAGPTDEATRGGRLRATASAQHPIALGAALVMLAPLALYLARASGRLRWYAAGGLLALGAFATVSRTSILMLIVVAAVFLWLRPTETKRLWPVLIPAVAVIHFALPGTLGTIKSAFFPEGGLIADQQRSAGTRGSGRIADLGPALEEWSAQPLLGQGFGTRVVDRGKDNAQILDNQWLKTLLETGIVGFVALLWLYVRAVKRFGRLARDDLSPRGWLLAGLTASIAAFAIGMFTYDAFSFIQVTFLSFLFLAFGSAIAEAPESGREARTSS